MGRVPLPFTLYRRRKPDPTHGQNGRKLKNKGTWYYSINRTSGLPRHVTDAHQRRSLGFDGSEGRATKLVQDLIAELLAGKSVSRGTTLLRFSTPFYTAECPHRKRIGWDGMKDRTAKTERYRLGACRTDDRIR